MGMLIRLFSSRQAAKKFNGPYGSRTTKSNEKISTRSFLPRRKPSISLPAAKLLQGPQLGKYRCYLCMSSQNHNILYFRCNPVTRCRKLRHSPVENPRTPLRLWVRPGPRGEEAGSHLGKTFFADTTPRHRHPQVAQAVQFVWKAVEAVDNQPQACTTPDVILRWSGSLAICEAEGSAVGSFPDNTRTPPQKSQPL
jgi:hypothetical protein